MFERDGIRRSDMLVRARELKEVSLIITFKIYNNKKK